MTKAAIARFGAGCTVVALAAPGSAFAHGHANSAHRVAPGRIAHVCRALGLSAPLTGGLAGLTSVQLTTLRNDCAAIQAAQQTAATALITARQQENATLAPVGAAVRAACADSVSSRHVPRDSRSAACVAALTTFRSTERAARTAYKAATQSALAPVSAAVNQLGSDLAAAGVLGPNGREAPHGAHHAHGRGARR